MKPQQFSSGEITIEYGLLGPVERGRKVALAFHGFSRPFDDMAAVQPLVGDRAVLALHLAAHGRSSGHHRPLDPEEWIAAIDALLASEDLALPAAAALNPNPARSARKVRSSQILQPFQFRHSQQPETVANGTRQ